MRIPNKIKEYIGKNYIDEIKDYHVSGDSVFNICNKYILKISDNIERLKREYEKDKWFKNVLPVSTPIIFIVEDNNAFYLKEYIDGEVLCLEKYLNNPNTLIKLLKEALTMFHNVDVTNCPFIVGDGNTIIHGDFCLPNILVSISDLKFSSVIYLATIITIQNPRIISKDVFKNEFLESTIFSSFTLITY